MSNIASLNVYSSHLPVKTRSSSSSRQNGNGYMSPIHTIIQDIRRKNGAAASHYASVGTLSSIDPWEDDNSAENNKDTFSRECTCRFRRRTLSGWRSSPRRWTRDSEQGKDDLGGLCSRCGMKIAGTQTKGFAWSRKSPGSFYHFPTKAIVAEPRHAEALLQSTPQLRFLSPESTDMQGAGYSHSNAFLNIFQPNKSDKKLDVPTGALTEYQASLVRNAANKQAAAELASLLWVLAHEMSLEDYGQVESEVFTSIFSLVHSVDQERRMAGLAALESLLPAPSADEERKAIKFANTLSNGLRAAHGDFEFLSGVCKAIGKMATRTANVDFVESEITRALEWLRTERSDRRLAACLTLKEFAIHVPTTFHSKTSHSTLGQGGSNEFLDHIFQAIRDPQPIVRACATDALSQCLRILVERRHPSLTGLLCQVHFNVMEGFEQDTSKKRPWNDVSPAAEASLHGSLLAVSAMVAHTRDFMLPRFEEVCRAVLKFTTNPKALIRLEVVRLLPRVARRCPHVFGRRYLEEALDFLLYSADNPPAPRVGVDIRPSAYTSLGQLIVAMTDESTGHVIGGSNLPTLRIIDDPGVDGSGGQIVELRPCGIIYTRLAEIFALVRKGLRRPLSSRTSGSESSTVQHALHCAANLVDALDDLAMPYMSGLIDDMFQAGLSNDLIQCLQSISECCPSKQNEIEARMLKGVSMCLAGRRNAYDPLASFNASMLQARGGSDVRYDSVLRQTPSSYGDFVYDPISGGIHTIADSGTEASSVTINMSEDPVTVQTLVLGLETLSSFGGATGKVTTDAGMVPLLPFVQDVASRYLFHPAEEVRLASVVTCCSLLVPHGTTRENAVGNYSGMIIEDVLQKLLRVAVSDHSPAVRLCVVNAFGPRYERFLGQTHHLQELFILLQDETLATRAAGLKLLGRLASINPGCVLPFMRRVLSDLILELQCGVDTGRVREEATRLLVIFLRAKALKRLVQPVLSTLISALPLDKSAPPRLASASLEALGELAQASGEALRPWIKEVIPHVLEIMEDRSSASKQRTSLRTLGQIAGSTGYVIRPYLDYPKLLSQATDILPATKRAPWSLRREVIRTLGIVGALDPDRYHIVSSKTRKGGAVGGAYFEIDFNEGSQGGPQYKEKTGPKPLALARASSTTGLSYVPTKSFASFGSRSGEKGLSQDREDKEDDQPAYLFMYEQYAMVAQPVSSLPPAKRMTPSDDEFYPTVAIQALMRIFRDPSLAVHHTTVVQAIMFIFKSLGLRCVPYLPKVVPHMIYAVRTCGPSNLRESLLMQLATLSTIVREHLRPFVADIFDVVEHFWSTRHLSTIFSLISNLAVGSPDEFKRFVPRLIQRILGTFDALQVADWSATERRGLVLSGGRAESEKLRLILKIVYSLKGVLGEYLGIIIPALLRLADSLATLLMNDASGLPESMLIELSVLVYRTTQALMECFNSQCSGPAPPYFAEERLVSTRSSESGLPSRVIQPLVRTLLYKPPKSPTVGLAIVETLCVCVSQIGASKWLKLYDGEVRSAITSWQSTSTIAAGREISSSSHRVDDRIVSCLKLYDESIEDLLLPPSERRASSAGLRAVAVREGLQLGTYDFPTLNNAPDLFDQAVSPGTSRQKVNQGKLQRAWDVSQTSSRDDWDEWMRRLAIQLLREAPSASLRAAASLAHAYQPLARELFSAAFACCWKELTEPYRVNLVNALKTAFVADVSPEILQALLNLAEFMEHDPSGGLPIEIPILADLALKCRAYAKALHYKEREFTMGATSACVESLISINGKLDLPEAALGILKASSVPVQEVEAEGEMMGEEGRSDVSKHQGHEMYYSVIWNTEDRNSGDRERVDLSAREELWLAKLGAWSEALAVYESKLQRDSHDLEAMVGCMRCLIANGEWRKVLDLANENWAAVSGSADSDVPEPREDISAVSQRKAVRMCAQAAWRLGQWGELERFSSQLVGMGDQEAISPGAGSSSSEILPSKIDFDGAFFSAVLHIHRREWLDAANAIDASRKAMDGRLTALMAESYSRAYPSMVTAQTLAEMEEIVDVRRTEERAHASTLHHPLNRPNDAEARRKLLSVWRERLAGCRVDAEVHSSILAVRSLILGPTDDVESVLTLSELSRQSQRYKYAERVLLEPLEALHADLNGPCFGFRVSEQLDLRVDFSGFSITAFPTIIDRIVAGDLRAVVPSYGPNHEQWSKTLVNEARGLDKLLIQYQLYFAFARHLWHTDRKDEALIRLSHLSEVVDMVSHCEGIEESLLRVNCWLELGEWKLRMAAIPGNSQIAEPVQADVLTAFKRATLFSNCGYRAWHAWALLNFRIALQITENGDEEGAGRGAHSSKILRSHIIAAVKGFINAINQGTRKWSASVQQDLLNLLTCLFKYGTVQDIAAIINESIGSVALEAWLGVLPQLLARIHIKEPAIRSVLHPLLTRLGEKHPQAMMYPLSVLLKSPVAERKNSAESLMNSLKGHSSALVEEALMVSSELIRVAILWLETWHEALEDGSRLYFGEGNVAAMLELLLPLHEKLEKGPETMREADFLRKNGGDLETAYLHIKDYISHVSDDGVTIPPAAELAKRRTEAAETALNRAWDTYYTVFRRINKQLPSLTKLELSQCSPALSRASNLELGIPGSYRVDGSYVNIQKFIPNVDVITSKQRPRKITLRGSDGKDYVFLLKAHEDLRQDERVMQLFGLVNALLVRDPQTRKHDLMIQRYAICPLSHDCGVVGWVPHCDTLHSLIRDYRSSKKIPLNMENREMLKIAPDYDLLTVMQKVEVFVEALKNTTGNGNDLYEILWLQSTDSEEWLERRTRFTRSLAVMSMVGYILGLGDRHPSNLMLDKLSGRVLHIDFGDCFEVAMNRDKFPEKVPFRLTRMLIRAMEVSGIEGSYRSTCEKTMSVLRDSRDSLVAMLEAFVYDPLISWRLADLSRSSLSGQDSAENNNDGNNDDDDEDRFASDPRDLGVPIEISGRSMRVDPISEGIEEEDGLDVNADADGGNLDLLSSAPVRQPTNNPMFGSASNRARSLQIYSSIQNMAANIATDSRIASVTGDNRTEQQALAAEGSMAHSRLERSMRQREMMSLLGGADGADYEEALNEKALKVIRRVEDKLTGTDCPDCANDGPLDVSDQVQRLIVQATSSENLCQLFIGWCSFW